MAANPSLQFGFQSSTEPNPYAVDSPATLLIKHLPDAITHDTLSRILYCYGASSVRPCSSGRVKNCAFVDFKNDMLASQAQDKLNGLKFYGKVLSVERANKLNENGGKSSGTQMGKDSNTSEVKSENVTNTIDGDIKSGGLPIPEPIAHRLGVDYPFPPHLEYVYPPPDGNILTNIVNALIAVPRFYTQVLHLMNKMNIPAPFRMALPTPPLPPEVPAPPPPVPTTHSITANPCSADMSSDESEMESSDEVTSSLLARDQTEPLYFLDPMYNSIKLSELDGARTEKSGRKRARRGAIVGPAIDKDVAHESVGVKPVTLIPKEIPMIKKNPVLKIKIAPKSTLKEHKDTGTEQELQELEKDTLDPYKFLTPDELEKGKLSRNDILSKFKNYSAGNPGPVLYIKNLHKDVIADDFYLLFGSLFGSTEAAKSELQIRLMQERRMRGQAFLTFPSTELAHRALSLVNGYVFKGNKPIIIQFGRKPTAAEGT